MKRSVLHLTLAIGFFAVAAGVLFARAAPAGGYEASIYTGTPMVTWIAFGLALAVAVGTTLTTRGRPQVGGIGLGATAMTAVVALPAIRNYRFLGMGDALTHLGWSKDFVAGELLPHELFYPGVHTVSSAFHLLGGVPLDRALLLTAVFVFVPFLVFVPLVVRDVTGDAAAVGFAAICSWMVLPINNVATHMGIHTNSNALFLVPVVLFAFVAYTRRRTDLESLPLGVSPLGVALLVAGVGLLLVHPQQMFNVVVALGAICLTQYLLRNRYDDHRLLAADHRTAYAHTMALGALFVVWVVGNARFRDAFGGLIYGLFAWDIGAGGEVNQRGSSLTEIGGSLTELFVKLFLVSALIGALVAIFVLLIWLGRSRADAETQTFVGYFAVALVPLGAIFVLYYVGTPTMAFRQVGFIYVLVTILGAVALAQGTDWLSGLVTTPGATAVASTVLGICLVLSLFTVFGSPYIYSPTQHVTDQQYSGYETTFEHASGEMPYAGFGSGVERYGDGINGVESVEGTYGGGGEGVVDPEAFGDGNYSGAYHPDRYYFVVTEHDVVREIDVYDELHHENDSLAGLETYEGANRLVSNDEFRLYTVGSLE